jgi:hypothetical protein
MISLDPCACGADELVRIKRALWMRLFRARRLYYCERCRSKQFIRKLAPKSTRSLTMIGG